MMVMHGAYKMQMRGSWKPLAARLPLPCRTSKVLCKWSQSNGCEWLYSRHHKPIKPHLRRRDEVISAARALIKNIRLPTFSSRSVYSCLRAFIIFFIKLGWSSLWCVLIAAVSSAVSLQLETIPHYNRRQREGKAIGIKSTDYIIHAKQFITFLGWH